MPNQWEENLIQRPKVQVLKNEKKRKEKKKRQSKEERSISSNSAVTLLISSQLYPIPSFFSFSNPRSRVSLSNFSQFLFLFLLLLFLV
jgi:hypothetical protein